MFDTAKYDPVSVYTSCAISDCLFALFKHWLHNNQNNDYSCNQTFHVRVHSHTVYRSSKVVCFDLATFLAFSAFLTVN